MPKLEILRSEDQNMPGLKRRIILLPVARIDAYDPKNAQIVIDTDFTLNSFDPPLVVIEATNKSASLSIKAVPSDAGELNDIELTLSYPGDARATHKNLMKVMRWKYFVVFVNDLNGNESDFRWKVLGTKEEPMEFSFASTSDPKRNNIKIAGKVTQLVPWYDPEANPETDLG